MQRLFACKDIGLRRDFRRFLRLVGWFKMLNPPFYLSNFYLTTPAAAVSWFSLTPYFGK